MFNGKPYQCNPELSGPKKGPCCSPAGYCGDTEAHCACATCVDYSKEKDGAASDETEDAAGSDDPKDGDAAGPDLEAECKEASEAGEELHNEYCGLECGHTMCKYPVGRGVVALMNTSIAVGNTITMHGWDYLQGDGPGWQGHHPTQAQPAEAEGCQGGGREPASSRKYEEAGQHQDYLYLFLSWSCRCGMRSWR